MVTALSASTAPVTPKAGQVWQRRDGSYFKIDHFTLGYAHYWLDRGSKPQFRSVRLDLLIKNYRLVHEPENKTA